MDIIKRAFLLLNMDGRPSHAPFQLGLRWHPLPVATFKLPHMFLAKIVVEDMTVVDSVLTEPVVHAVAIDEFR
jgi:hypothetical protein